MPSVPEHLAREALGRLGLGRARQQLAGRDVAGELEQGGGLLGGEDSGGRHGLDVSTTLRWIHG